MKEIKIEAKNGWIKAKEMPDDEYPGILLVYEADGNGEPGVLLEWDKAKDQIVLRVWDNDTVDTDPKHLIVLG